ncbi:MAG: alpha/beta fold hydrolase [Candidatus Paceibacterota bacterium]
MKQQIVIIHGGTTFETYEEYLGYLESCKLTIEKIKARDWKDRLQSVLPDFDVLYPKMPNAKNARYPEWKMWFEKLFPLLNDEVVLIGHSLGGIFLAKYLAENKFPKKIKSVHLVAPPYDTEHCKDSLADFELGESIEGLGEQTERIFLYQSKDDEAVPYQDAEKYKKNIPHIKLQWFEDRGHFTQETFPELIEDIKDS